ncbi:hypothetical protein cyc_05157 [Cyclospora cayetanensis]|uniref:Uncharacterized protein n=1 Tax=Cyclospora cayetanensis TaxID=88456 RepID=A0A1D3D2B8_9EIME|nr:hypothetical protein cyc_05157 [Cyclospora cayetanensis]
MSSLSTSSAEEDQYARALEPMDIQACQLALAYDLRKCYKAAAPGFFIKDHVIFGERGRDGISTRQGDASLRATQQHSDKRRF